MINVYLKIQKVDETCLFELSWGKSQQINAQVTYPEIITSSYQEWQRFYRKFYSSQMRGKVINQGVVAPPVTDWRTKLVQSEAKLLSEFDQWLRSSKLFEIRSKIVFLSKEFEKDKFEEDKLEEDKNKKYKPKRKSITNIFISCNDLELARLPWEAWEIGTEFATDKIRIVRQPINIIQSTSEPVISRKARVLAILGDDTNLNFETEKTALQSLNKIVDIKFIGWKPGKYINELKQEIITALTLDKGWDILFFAGHSNETYLTGGEIAVAPNTCLYLSELETHLSIAKQKGLQVAIFNSCSGLSIANKLIDLGISQVAIMREPIHNLVATDFIVKFSQALAEYKDVHECLLAASQYLKVEKNLTYPSSYLVPSLFCHPAAPFFRIKPFGIRHQIKQWFPKRREVLTIGTLVIISCLPPLQDALRDWRIGVQSAYRQVTQQIPSQTSPPPILLIHVDEKSLNDAETNAYKFNPIDRRYLAKIIDKLTLVNAKVVGIDYLLDRVTDEDKILAGSIRNSLQKNNTLFVFGSILNYQEQEQGVRDSIANLNQVLQGYVDKIPGHISLLNVNDNCTNICPFTYVLALTYSFCKEELTKEFNEEKVARLQSSNHGELRAKLINIINSDREISSQTKYLNKLRLNQLTTYSENFGQTWLYPIIDFSIPPEQVYQVISANDFLKKDNSSFEREKLQQQIVLIGAGGYEDAGLSPNEPDNFPIPKGVAYWRLQNPANNYIPTITGVEINAYMIHHLLKQHLIYPIPNLWMIGIAILIGKGTQMLLAKQQFSRRDRLVLFSYFAGGNIAFALSAIQLYIWGNILLPLFLPSAVFWFYVLTKRKNK